MLFTRPYLQPVQQQTPVLQITTSTYESGMVTAVVYQKEDALHVSCTLLLDNAALKNYHVMNHVNRAHDDHHLLNVYGMRCLHNLDTELYMVSNHLSLWRI